MMKVYGLDRVSLSYKSSQIYFVCALWNGEIFHLSLWVGKNLNLFIFSYKNKLWELKSRVNLSQRLRNVFYWVKISSIVK